MTKRSILDLETELAELERLIAACEIAERVQAKHGYQIRCYMGARARRQGPYAISLGLRHKATELRRKIERAKNPPPRRTHAQVVRDNRAHHARTVAGPIARTRAARRNERSFSPSASDVVRALHDAGGSLYEIAKVLETHGFRTPRGRLRWSAEQVKRELKRPRSDKLERLLPSVGTRKNPFARYLRLRANEGSPGYRGNGDLLTALDRATKAWWHETDRSTPEPRVDSRGRVLKGRRFSKIKRHR